MERSKEIHIQYAKKGIIYTCPYCDGSLAVKAGGPKVAKHFAHTGETCAESRLADGNYHPFADLFEITGTQALILEKLCGDKHFEKDAKYPPSISQIWEMAEEFTEKPRAPVAELIEKGFIVCIKTESKLYNGHTTEKKLYGLEDLCWVFRYENLEAYIERFNELREEAAFALKLYWFLKMEKQTETYGFIADPARLARMAGIGRLLEMDMQLYLISFPFEGKRIYKIGRTFDFNIRIKQLKSDITLAFESSGEVKIEAIIAGAGYLECFFKNRWRKYNCANGLCFTEYYRFPAGYDPLKGFPKDLDLPF